MFGISKSFVCWELVENSKIANQRAGADSGRSTKRGSRQSAERVLLSNDDDDDDDGGDDNDDDSDDDDDDDGNAVMVMMLMVNCAAHNCI